MTLATDQLVDAVSDQFGSSLAIFEKRPGIYQLAAPLYHEDGDAIEIFLEQIDDQIIRVSDYGMALMRLSYVYDLDSDKKKEILERIIRENRAHLDNGSIYIETSLPNLHSAIMQLAQVIAKVTNMKYFGREVVENLFYEMLDEFVLTQLRRFEPISRVTPLLQQEEYEADYELHPNGKPYYLFGVKDNLKARLVTIACQQFTLARLPFSSIVVHNDFERLSARDRKLLTNACDKQFTSLEDFQTQGMEYLSRQQSP